MLLTLVITCANVYGECIIMARRDAFIQPYQFDPEFDPEGEADSAAAAGHFQNGYCV